MCKRGFAIGMRKNGTVWWEDGQQYVELMKSDGPVLIMALSDEAHPEYPNLARILKTATDAEAHGQTYAEAHHRLKESGEPVQGWWGSFAATLMEMFDRKKSINGAPDE